MLIRLKLVLAVAAACLPASQVSLGSVMGRLEVCSTLEVFVKGHPPLFSQLLAAAMLAVQDTAISAQITAGTTVDAGRLLKQFQDTAAAAAALVTAAPGEQCVAAGVQLSKQLTALGVALNTLPVSSMCNNPHCTNFAEASEQKLVKGSSHVCAGCRAARYCSKECLGKHWKQHKPVCKALGAARGPSAAASQPDAAST